MNPLPALIGTPLSEVETPALLLDLDAFDRNVARMAEYAASAKIALRPHAKTHRCPTIAHAQIAHGAVGLCCQKVGEAEVLVSAGVHDVLVSNEVLDIRKLRRLAKLARKASVSLCFDAPEQVDAASRAAQEFDIEFGALVELDMGMWRCGVTPGEPAAVLARTIADAPGLRFLGLQAYEGKAQHIAEYAARRAAIEQAAASVRQSIAAIERIGLTCTVVGGGGTGTFRFEGDSQLWTELQCGSYIFMDGEYAAILEKDGAPYAEFEQSLFVLTTVMSATTPGRAVVDAGLKSYTLEKGLPGVHGHEDVRVVAASDEHGTLLVPPGTSLSLGTQLKLVPSHCDPTVNLHDFIVGVRDGVVESIWPIAARGASL